MGTNILLFGWDRPYVGREHISARHFEEFVKYLNGLQQAKEIDAFEIVFMDSHGGDLNGFFLVRASSAKLDALVSSAEWVTHMARASLHLQRPGVIRGVTGERIAERMALWTGLVPA